MNFERIIKISPAFDRRNPDPTKDYGIHGCDLLMVLKGEKGAVQFLLFTNWHLPHVTNETLKKYNSPGDIGRFFTPIPADLGYHSPEPRYEGQSQATKSCEWLDGRPCYYDGSGLNAEEVYDILLKEGSKGVWKFLEDYYYQAFAEKDMQ